MSEIKVNKISPRTACGTTTLGDSGDTFTIPAGVTITNNGTQTGFGRTGTVDWQTSSIKTSTFTAANGEGYFADTSSGGFTMNLPAGSAGNIVSVVDYTNTFQTNALTISPNGSEKIGGVAANFIASTEGQSLTFVYVDGTEGWKNIQDSTSNAIGNAFFTATGGTITTCGNDKIHTFTSPGSFVVTNLAAVAAQNDVSYMVVAGGGGGGTTSYGAGGGAGGYREGRNNPITPYTASPKTAASGLTIPAVGTFPITVGAGGASTAPSSGQGASGSPSIFSSITSTGGGGGGGGPYPVSGGHDGSTGGSGGGGSGIGPAGGTSCGGAGNTPPVSPSQGNPGGNADNTPNATAGGGGGGASENGINIGGTTNGGRGGAGTPTQITGSAVSYAGGGGGMGSGASGAASPCSTGGAGGGPGTAGTTNRGGGGGSEANGGSGVVIIRYKFQ
jgi:hypothetical protein